MGLQLPEASTEATRVRMRRQSGGAAEAPPPPEVQQAIDGITALLRGEAADLSTVMLDLDGIPEFDRRVYRLAREIPPGETITYGSLAARLGSPDLARAVGQALGRNRFPIVVPCHRVVAAGGRLGGFSARGGNATKRRILGIEIAGRPGGLFS